jgi:hypothetical protein
LVDKELWGTIHVHSDCPGVGTPDSREICPTSGFRVSRGVGARKVEFLEAGVLALVVLDEESETALLYLADAMPRRLGPDDELVLPVILPGFAVAVREFFARAEA